MHAVERGAWGLLLKENALDTLMECLKCGWPGGCRRRTSSAGLRLRRRRSRAPWRRADEKSRALVEPGIAAVLFYLDRLQPDAAAGLGVHVLRDVVEHVAGRRLASDRRQDAQIDEARAREGLEGRALRVVLGDERGVIEGLVEPLPHGLQAPEVVAPVARVQLARGEIGRA